MGRCYVIKYKNRKINRFFGEGGILKIGCTEDRLKKKFKYYNHQSDMTVKGDILYLALKERSQKTNVRLMYFLAHDSGNDDIIVDFYESGSDKKRNQVLVY